MSLITELTTAIAAAPTWQSGGEITIATPEQYVAVVERRKTIRAWIGGVKDFFKPIKKQADDLHASICQKERGQLRPAEDDLAVCDRALRAWDDEQARVAAETRRRLEEQARKDEESRRLNEAAALEREAQATGDVALRAEAEELISAPIETPVVMVQKATPKVEGMSWRDNWKAEVIDANAVPRQYCTPDLSLIGGVVRNSKGAIKIPGVRVYNDRKPVTSGGAR